MAIPKNYPLEEERHKGFFRESASWEGVLEPIYIVEAEIEGIKKPYLKPSRSGHVKLLESRKYESERLDSLDSRIYAGGHHLHRFDIVGRREFFLQNPDGIKYKILDTLKQKGKNLYRISFEKKNRFSGQVFVMDSSFAITRVDFKNQSFFSISNQNRQYLTYTVTYEQSDDKKWRMKHSHYETAFKKRNKLLTLISDYVTTEFQKNKSDIPYLDRLQFSDIILDESKEYKPDFWNNHNTILPAPELEPLFESMNLSGKRKSGSRSNTLIAIIMRLKMEISLELLPLNVRLDEFMYANPAMVIQQGSVFSKEHTWGMSYSLFYELGSRFYLGYTNKTKLTKSGTISHDIGLSKFFNLNPKGRPIFIKTGFNIGHQELTFYLDNYETSTPFEINGKSFDSGKTDIFLATRGFRLRPNLGLELEYTNRLSLLLSAGYNFEINSKEGLKFHEKGGSIFFPKKVFLKNGNENLNLNHTNSLLKNRLGISVGVSYKF